MIRQKGNNIKNKCQLAIQHIFNATLPAPEIINWNQIEKNTKYHDQLQKIQQLYDQNPEFKLDIRRNTRRVIITRISADKNIKKAIDEGINYLLKEIAFLMAAPEIFKCSKVAFVYHKDWELLQNFINGKYDNIVQKNIGYVIIN